MGLGSIPVLCTILNILSSLFNTSRILRLALRTSQYKSVRVSTEALKLFEESWPGAFDFLNCHLVLSLRNLAAL